MAQRTRQVFADERISGRHIMAKILREIRASDVTDMMEDGEVSSPGKGRGMRYAMKPR